MFSRVGGHEESLARNVYKRLLVLLEVSYGVICCGVEKKLKTKLSKYAVTKKRSNLNTCSANLDGDSG